MQKSNRKLVFFVCLPFCIMSCAKQHFIPNDLQLTASNAGLRGHVLWIKEGVDLEIYDPKGHLTYRRMAVGHGNCLAFDTVKFNEDLYTFDTKGNIVRHTGDGLFGQTARYQYDAKGRCASIAYSSSCEEDMSKYYIYKYDADGNKTTYCKDGNKPEYLEALTRYNRHGQVTENIFYNSKGVLIWSDHSIYDRKGRRVEMMHTSGPAGGGDNNKEICTYSAHGSTSSTDACAADGKLQTRTTKRYDHMRIAEEVTERFDRAGNKVSVETINYTYNEAGLLLKKVSVTTTTPQRQTVVTDRYSGIDEQGNYRIRECTIDKSWDKENGHQYSKYVREIEYYH